MAATAELLYGEDLKEPIIQHLAAELFNVISFHKIKKTVGSLTPMIRSHKPDKKTRNYSVIRYEVIHQDRSFNGPSTFLKINDIVNYSILFFFIGNKK